MPDRDTVWGFERALTLRFPDLTYRGRPITMRDRAVRGSILYHGWIGEVALDIDYPNHEVYERLWRQVKRRATSNGLVRHARLPQAVCEVTRGLAAPSREGRQVTIRRYAKACGKTALQQGDLVCLSAYLQGTGMLCLEYAATATVMLQDCMDMGYIPDGRISLDRNSVRQPDGGRPGHAWTRYAPDEDATPENTLVIDASRGGPHGYCDTLAASRMNATWDYLRPEDRQLLR